MLQSWDQRGVHVQSSTRSTGGSRRIALRRRRLCGARLDRLQFGPTCSNVCSRPPRGPRRTRVRASRVLCDPGGRRGRKLRLCSGGGAPPPPPPPGGAAWDGTRSRSRPPPLGVTRRRGPRRPGRRSAASFRRLRSCGCVADVRQGRRAARSTRRGAPRSAAACAEHESQSELSDSRVQKAQIRATTARYGRRSTTLGLPLRRGREAGRRTTPGGKGRGSRGKRSSAATRSARKRDQGVQPRGRLYPAARRAGG